MSRENATDLGGKMTTGLLRIVPWLSIIFYKDMLHARIQQVYSVYYTTTTPLQYHNIYTSYVVELAKHRSKRRGMRSRYILCSTLLDFTWP